MVELTKDADKLLGLIYYNYLVRIKDKQPKRQARYYADSDNWPNSFRENFCDEDIRDLLAELKRAGFVKIYLYGAFELEDAGIIFMEKRFPRGLEQVFTWLERLVTLIPYL